MILFLILKCNHLVDICHLDAPRILPESPFTLKCGNSDALSTLSARSLETYILTVTFCSNFLHCSIFSHPTYPKPAIFPSLYTFSPHSVTLCFLFYPPLSAPLLLPPKTSKVRSGENSELMTESVYKGEQAWERRCKLNKTSSLTGRRMKSGPVIEIKNRINKCRRRDNPFLRKNCK